MECFNKARAIRLRSHLGKYLTAHDDQQSVRQTRNGSSVNATWTVERVEGHNHCIRLKSCHGKYLTASTEPFLLGMTGKKAVQSIPATKKESSSVEWEPRKEGYHVRLRTRGGSFLRANGAMPPWRNSVTHDVPKRTATQDWVLWVVEVVALEESPPYSLLSPAVSSEKFASSERWMSIDESHLVKNDETSAPLPAKGRTVYYNVTKDDEGKAENAESQPSFTFNGTGLVELTQKLKEETGVDDFIVCSRNQINGKLYPLRLQLPPNNADMHVVLVPSSSKVARDLQEAR